MQNDTNFYLLALEEFQQKYPLKRRATDMTPKELSEVMARASQLKEESNGQIKSV